MRKLYWYVSAYIAKYGKTLLFSLCVALLVFWVFLPRMLTMMRTLNKEYVGVVGQYTLPDLPLFVKEEISAGLTIIEPNGSVSPLLAERWSVEQDGTMYRFILKENIRWQDGELVEPDDINYRFNDVETITTLGDIVFKLPDTFAPFPAAVAEPILKVSQERSLLFRTRYTFVGIGKNSITQYKTHDGVLDELTIEKPEQSTVYRFYQTEQDAMTAFKRGEVDTLKDLSRTYDIMDWPTTTTTVTNSYQQYVALFFDNANPLFQKNIRQGLAYALSVPENKTPAYSPISPSSWGYLKSVKQYNQDVPRAIERLLDQVPGEPLNLEITTTTQFAADAERIKTEWEAMGDQAVSACQSTSNVEDKDLCQNLDITVTIRISNFPDTNNFSILLLGQEIPSDPDQYHLWHSGQNTNFTHYKNTRIDSILEKARKTSDQKERQELYYEFQQFFSEDVPVIFLYYLDSYSVERSAHTIDQNDT
ncbi:MAG: hypothetical protein H6774_01555 [Pseudomonadales bacterium]|nr:hypothetical protein [Candidatus Woesebacteria bacterium]MCB9801754.1 hypothetical protein [Pseudomonadales bacterium]